ncbi:MAG: rhodanese-like domain-containing protein, partial [Hyphomicrobiales bacterium]|nr:rhodanese-like domain-containing protein [Hyphomicrobiales bacterium]
MTHGPKKAEYDAREVEALLRADAVTLVDVREPHEHKSANIPGAALMPLSRFDALQLPAEPGKFVVLYCRSGARSMSALSRCMSAGVPAAHLRGG